jgi:hypothetical protein
VTPEEKSLLERTYRLAEENNKMLRKMRRAERWRSLFQGLYWLFIVGLTVGAIYYVQPYITAFTNVFKGASTTSGTSSQNLSMLQEFENLMKGK